VFVCFLPIIAEISQKVLVKLPSKTAFLIEEKGTKEEESALLLFTAVLLVYRYPSAFLSFFL